MADENQGENNTDMSDIEVDPILQGSDRAGGQEKIDSRLSSDAEDTGQDTQTRANIHMGGRDEQGEGSENTTSVSEASTSDDESGVVETSENTNSATDDVQPAEEINTQQAVSDEQTTEEASLSSGRATSALNFDANNPAAETNIPENNIPAGEADATPPLTEENFQQEAALEAEALAEEDQTASEDTPPADETPVDETPVDETPVDETPVGETPVDETPVDETPVGETPVDETPVDETPVDETPVGETPVDETPVDETPVGETPVDETPVDETPVGETPVDETPVDETPVGETPVDETPVDETPVGETPVDETPVDETPVGETPVDETPVDETPVGETPVDETPVDETPVDETPVDETPVNETPVNETPVVDPVPANSDPSTVADIAAMTEDQAAFPIDVLANDSDEDGDSLFITDVSVKDGLGAVSHDGTMVTFNPGSAYDNLAEGEEAQVELSYSVSDGQGGTSEETAIVTVTGTNDAPVVSNVELGTASEDGSITFSEADLLAGASDVDGDDLSVSGISVDPAQGTVTDNGDGTYSFEPAADFNGDVSLSFDVSDGTTTTTASADLSVDAVNDAPVVSNVELGTASEDGSITFSEADLLSGASDVDGDDLSVSGISVDPAQGTVTDNGDGTYSFEPAADFNGDVSLSFDVSDGSTTTTASADLSVDAVNDAPVVSNVELGTASEDGSITFSEADLLAGASDVDGDDLSVAGVSVDPAQGTVTDNGDGTYSFEPAADFNGDVSLSFDVSDGTTTTTASADLSVDAVNDAPVVSNVELGTASEDGSITFSEADLLSGASDVDGDDLSVSGISVDPAQGTVTDNGDGTYSFEPAADFNGDVSLSFDVSDGSTTTTASADLSVDAVNDAPVVSNVELGTASEDGSITFSEADLLAGASDVDGDDLSVAGVSVDPSQGTVTDNGDGTYSFEPAADFNGDVSLSFDVSDGTTTTTASADLSVDAVNDAPVVSNVELGTASEDGSITFSEADLLAGASDVDGDDLSVAGVSVDPSQGTVTDNGDGTYSFEPAADFNGDVSLSFDVSDGSTTTTASADLSVDAVNDAPVVSNVELGTASEDGSITFSEADLLSGASDVDGDDLSVAGVSVDPAQGTVTDNGDGTYSFEPSADFNGDVSLSFDVSDGSTTTTASADLSVDAVNDAPVVSNVELGTASEDGSITFSEADLLAGASDVDGDDLSVAGVSVDPAQGTVTDNGDGTYSFEPAADFNGDVSLSFDVSDGTTTTTASAELSVDAVNDAPVVSNVELGTASEDGSITFSEADLLSGASDVDGDDLSVAGVSVDPAQGSITDNGDGTYSFEPSADFNGDVSLSFDVSDGSTTTTASADLSVDAVNDAPVVSNVELGTASEDGSITFSEADLLAGASDVDGDDLSVSGISVDPSQGTVTDNGDGTYSFEPAADFNGDVSLSFDVSDGSTTTTASADLSIDAVNDAPVVSNVELGTASEDGSITFSEADLLSGASDVDGDDLSVSGISVDPAQGTVTENGDGTYSFEPAADFNGDVSLSFDVSDGSTTTTASADLSVDAVNDAPVVSNVELGTASEDGSITFSEADLLSGASDVDGDDLSVSGISVDPSQGTVTDNGDGTYSFEPAADFNGDVSLSFDVSDGTTTTTASADLSVDAVNDAPVVSNVELGTASEDGSITFSEADLLAGASDVDGDDLSVAGVSVDPSQGSITDNGDGTYSFEPAADFNGDVSLSFDVSDGTTTTTASADLSVDAVNDAPVVSNVELGTASEDGSITFSEADLLAGASDVDGDDLSVAGVSVDPSQGSITDNGDGTYSFEPAADFNGDVSLSFDVSDGTTTTTASADLSVDAVNDAPVVSNVELGTTGEEIPITFTDADLLAGASDVDGDDLSISSVSVDPSQGSLIDNGDGTYVFEPADDFEGDVAIDFDVSDGTTTTTASANLEVVDDDDDDNHNDDGDNNGDDGNVDAFSGNLSNKDDVFEGSSGDDVISGMNGDDTIHSGGGNDIVDGGHHNDYVDGGDGDDVINGGHHNDTLLGGSGNDTLNGGFHEDTLTGGSGDDILNGGEHEDTFVFGGASGNDTVDGGEGWTDTIELNAGVPEGSEQGWTLTLEDGTSISSTDVSGDELSLGDDASGTIVMDDGSTITFDNVEEIVW